jgi:hypothetical protein
VSYPNYPYTVYSLDGDEWKADRYCRTRDEAERVVERNEEVHNLPSLIVGF